MTGSQVLLAAFTLGSVVPDTMQSSGIDTYGSDMNWDVKLKCDWPDILAMNSTILDNKRGVMELKVGPNGSMHMGRYT